jgi:hypothetical protein
MKTALVQGFSAVRTVAKVRNSFGGMTRAKAGRAGKKPGTHTTYTNLTST